MKLIGEKTNFFLHFFHLDRQNNAHFFVNLLVLVQWNRAHLCELPMPFLLIFLHVFFLVLTCDLFNGGKVIIGDIELDYAEWKKMYILSSRAFRDYWLTVNTSTSFFVKTEFLFLLKKFFSAIKCEDSSKRKASFLATSRKS